MRQKTIAALLGVLVLVLGGWGPASADASDIHPDFRVSIGDALGNASYPKSAALRSGAAGRGANPKSYCRAVEP